MRAFRERGLKAGDGIALLCSNRVEFVEVYAAVLRGGFRLTAINWHLTAEEVGYIVADCEAKAFVVDVRFSDAAGGALKYVPDTTLGFSIGGSIPGFEDYEGALRGVGATDLVDPVLGNTMLYTSGTTGRPKGVFRKGATQSSLTGPMVATAVFQPEQDRNLITGPLYHAAPLLINMAGPLAAGVGSILMDRWDEREALPAHRETSRDPQPPSADDVSPSFTNPCGGAGGVRCLVASLGRAWGSPVSGPRKGGDDRLVGANSL